MNLVIPVIGAAVVLGGIAALAMADDTDSQSREMWLIKNKSYYIVHQMTGLLVGVPFNPTTYHERYAGFCNFSPPTVTGANTESSPLIVTFTAQWCAENTLFDVPENMAVTEGV